MPKKLLSLFCAILMLITSFPLAVFAEEINQPKLTIISADVTPGEAFEVNVNLENNPGIVSAGLRLAFDEGLTLVGATNGDVFSTLTYIPPKQLSSGGIITSGCQFAWTGFDIADADIKNGTILTLSFELSDEAEIGDTFNISITSELGDIVDRDLNEYALSAEGKVTAIDYMPGDVNDDGKINMMDIVVLSRYIVDGCKYDPDGYAVRINESAAEVNADTKINMMDVVLISRYIVDGCETVPEPDGYNVTLLPSRKLCSHTLQKTEAKDATCTEEGNIAYWQCTKCNKYFTDENGNSQISAENVKIEAKGHAYSDNWSFDQTYHWHASKCEHTNLVADKQEHNFSNDNICVVCQAGNTPDPTKPYKITYELFEYNQNKGDTYLPSALIDNSKNPSYYSSTDSFRLETPTCDGYSFEGWYTIDGNPINKIETGTNKNLILQARWSEITYDVTYKLFKTPIADTIKEEYKSYTVSKGLVDMPNPDIYNFIFLGWYDNSGTEITNIPAGTTGDIVLNAHFVSKRNLTKPVNKLDDPIILENTDKGVLYFAYEIGSIENIPLQTLWEIQSLYGLTSQKSEEKTWSISKEQSEVISETISKATVDSGTWSMSENWEDSFDVNYEWAKEQGMTQEEAKEAIKTSSNSYSFTYSNGGSKETNSTNGTTTLDYNSVNNTEMTGVEVDVNASVTASTEVKAGFMKGEWEVSASAGVNNKHESESNKHTGTDTTNVNTKVSSNSSTWNSASTSQQTNQESTSESVRNAFSEIFSETKGYGKSYSKGGEGSESFGSSTTESETSNTSSTLTFTTAEGKTTTETYSTDGKYEGHYRQVVAGTAHVFAVVAYDIASRSYFTYTYSVLDDEVKLFLDYSPDGSFTDNEHSVLPFEVPFDVYEFVSEITASTDGLGYITNSSTKTATVNSYNGNDTEIMVPSYISAGGIAYKVTGIKSTAFAGKPIRSIVLSEYIDEIPDSAFEDCIYLEEISGYYTKIGDKAFSGCSKLKDFNVSAAISEVGEKAFLNVPQIKVNALNAESAWNIAITKFPEADETAVKSEAQRITQELVSSVIKSGADKVIIDISTIDAATELTIDVPQISLFELNGAGKTFKNLTLKSNADTTILSNIVIDNENKCPLVIYSDKLVLEAVTVRGDYYTLILHYDGAEVVLYKDTHLFSEKGRAIVCKNATVVSKSIDFVSGTLEVCGNVYVCGNAGNINENACPDYVELYDGSIITISEKDINSYVKGIFTVSFNANEGNVNTDSIDVTYGSALGELPIPTRDYYTFDGWYTDKQEGEKVTSDSVMKEAEDITLYAHWTPNSTSDWVLASEIPDDAQVVDEKWTYTLRSYKTSENADLDGWNEYDSQITSYGEKQGPVYSDPSNGTRKVTSEKYVTSSNYKTEYVYYHYHKDGSHDPVSWVKSSTYPNYAEFVVDSQLSKGGTSSNGDPYYKYWHSSTNWWVVYFKETRQQKVSDNYGTRWYYQEPIYTYYYFKDTELESTADPTGQDDVSNVVKWVKYINK